MISFIVWVLTTLALFVNFRYHKKYQINTFQAIVFNYSFCVLTGIITEGKLPSVPFEGNFVNVYWIAAVMGFVFVSSFYLTALCTQKAGIAVTNLAGRISLIIPVFFNLFVFKAGNAEFGLKNYFGVFLALIAVFLSIAKFEKKTEKEIEEPSAPAFFKNEMIILPLIVFFVNGFNDTVLNYAGINYVGTKYAADFSIMLFFSAGIAGLMMLTIRVLQGKEKIKIRNIVAGAALGVPNFFSVYLMFFTLKAFDYNGAMLYPVFNISVIIGSLLLAKLLFLEKFFWYNYAGIATAILAILLIAF
jgi:drug/metabolite transporter (DMT)-like permease